MSAIRPWRRNAISRHCLRVDACITVICHLRGRYARAGTSVRLEAPLQMIEPLRPHLSKSRSAVASFHAVATFGQFSDCCAISRLECHLLCVNARDVYNHFALISAIPPTVGMQAESSLSNRHPCSKRATSHSVFRFFADNLKASSDLL
jgi:hypothetical protein